MFRALALTLFLLITACSKKPLSPGLVSTSELGSLRGKHFVRVITHFHSPYSFDACDGKGINADGSINTHCLHDAKFAFCENHINFIFTTDHVSHLSSTEFSSLILNEAGDTALLNGADPVGNRISCADGFGPIMFPGLEGKFLGLGMQKHVAPDQASREAVYGAFDASARDALTNTAGALVTIPHTESKDLIDLIALQPKAIEIYNLHANLDPKIRKKYLHRNPFDKVGKFINYLADPFNSLNPDYLFMDFLEFNDVYFQVWDGLLAAGVESTGLGGLDSHENIFSEKASDGERLDHHRRMTRMMNNFVFTNTDDESSVKAAIENGAVYFVVEGLGTPMGLDFHGVVSAPGGDTTTEMGSGMSPAGSTSKLSFSVPAVISSFPGMDSGERPEVWADLIYVNGAGVESVVATTHGTTLEYSNPPAGHYRVHVKMKPHHLRDFLFNTDHADEEYLWIISNHIKVNP